VRQRNKVAACANGTFARNFRQDAAIQSREQEINQFFANSRKTARQSVRASQHDGACFTF
jgi:hypothetical protein